MSKPVPFLQHLAALITGGEKAHEAESRALLDEILARPREERLLADDQQLADLLPHHRREFLASLMPNTTITFGMTFRKAALIAAAFSFLSLVAGAGLVSMSGLSSFSGDEARISMLAWEVGLDDAFKRYTPDQIRYRLTLSDEAAALIETVSRSEQDYAKLVAVSSLINDAPSWVSLALYAQELGTEGADFARWIGSLEAGRKAPSDDFAAPLFNLVPGIPSSGSRIDWSGATQRLIRALGSLRNGDDLVFSSPGESRIAVMAALEKMDDVRRKAVLRVLGANDADMALIAEHGLPLPLSGDRLAAYETILSFSRPVEQVASCRRGASLSPAEWKLFDWARSDEGTRARLVYNASVQISPDIPRPCLALYEAGTEEWKTAGSWHRTDSTGASVNIDVCLIEVPPEILSIR